MGSPIYLPNVNPRPSPWEGFISAYLQGLEMRRQREQFQSQMEDRKMQRQYQSALIKAQEREDALKARGGSDFDLLKLMQTMPGQQFGGGNAQIETPGFATDLQGGMAPPTQQNVSMPPVSLPFHDVQTETMGTQRVPSREATMLQMAQEAYSKAQSERLGRRVDVPPQLAEMLGLGNGPVDPSVLTAAGSAATALAPQRPRAPVSLTMDIPELGLKKGDQVDPSQLQTQTGLANASATRAQASATRESAQANTKFQQTQKLADQYQERVKNFERIQTSLGSAEELFAAQQQLVKEGQAPNPQFDETLLFQYLQVREAVPNVVREGERAMWNSTLGLADRAKTALTRARGAGLPPDIRQQLMNTIRVLGRATTKQRGSIDTEFGQKARRWSIDPADVLNTTPSGGASTTRPRATNPTTGKAVEWDGQAWVPVQ